MAIYRIKTTIFSQAAMTALAVGIAAMPACWTSAAAQDTGAGRSGAGSTLPGDTLGNDIVVTARRVDERLQDVPVSIVAMSQEMLDKKGLVSVEDVLREVPGVRRDLGGNTRDRNDSNFIMRGQTSNNAGAEPAVVVYFAGVPLNPVGSNVPVFDISSVQFLRGPKVHCSDEIRRAAPSCLNRTLRPTI